MAAKPKERKLKAMWLRLGVEMFGPELDGRPTDMLDWPLAQLADGMTVTALAEKLQGAEYMNEAVSRSWISGIMNRHGKDRVKAARATCAGVLAEEAVAIADRPVSSTAEAQRARLQVDVRKWLSGVMDRDSYGDRPQVAVNLSLGELHLSTLRRRAVVEASSLPRQLASGEPDFETAGHEVEAD